jgi:hypothetical protein
MRSAGGSLRRASWWSLRRTALRSLGRYKISVPANWKRIVYMYTSIIIQHHPSSSNIIQHHHPIILSLALSSTQVCFVPKRQTYIRPWALQLVNTMPHIVNPCCLTHPFSAAGLKLRCLQRGCDRSCRLLGGAFSEKVSYPLVN